MSRSTNICKHPERDPNLLRASKPKDMALCPALNLDRFYPIRSPLTEFLGITNFMPFERVLEETAYCGTGQTTVYAVWLAKNPPEFRGSDFVAYFADIAEAYSEYAYSDMPFLGFVVCSPDDMSQDDMLASIIVWADRCLKLEELESFSGSCSYRSVLRVKGWIPSGPTYRERFHRSPEPDNALCCLVGRRYDDLERRFVCLNDEFRNVIKDPDDARFIRILDQWERQWPRLFDRIVSELRELCELIQDLRCVRTGRVARFNKELAKRYKEVTDFLQRCRKLGRLNTDAIVSL